MLVKKKPFPLPKIKKGIQKMIEWGKSVGGFIRWLIKGCKTNLRDEIEGNFEAQWLGSYGFENYVIGYITIAILILLFGYFFIKV